MPRPRPRRHRLSFDSLENRRVPATISVAPVTVLDSSSASGATFTATLAEASSTGTTLTYSTSDGSAKAGRDYIATRGTVTIPAGELTATFTIDVKPTDVSGKSNLVFYVNLKSSSGNTVKSKVAATIVDDLARPTASVSDVIVTENGKGGTTHSSVQVKLSNPSARPVVVYYSTSDDTAKSTGSDRDYQSAHGSVTIKPGSTTASIPLTIDARATTDKVFDVILTGTAGGQVVRNPAGEQYARVVIRDSNSTTTEPYLSVSSPTVIEGDVAVFDVTLSSASTVPVSVRYFTVDGTATTSQYTAVNGVLTIPAGQTSAAIVLPTTSGTPFTGSQQFQLGLASPANATLASKYVTATILDTLPRPTLSVASPAAVSAPTPGSASTVDFVVTLSSSYVLPVTVNYATVDGTAVAGTNYAATSGTLTFAPGVTSLTVPVTLLASMGAPTATNETFNLVLSSPTDATITTATATATITAGTGIGTGPGGGTGTGPTSPVASAALTVGSSPAIVGTTGTATLTFTVSLAAASTSTVTVDYATSDNSAIAGTDYTATSGTLTFAPGVTSLTVPVTVYGETTTDSDKTFNLNLSNATNAIITNNASTGDILYASSTPAISVAPASASVGATGTSTLTFTVSLSAVSTSTVSVNYATADGTAIAGTDYTATSGTLTFAPGTVSQTVTVTATGESSTVASKTLSLILSGGTDSSNAAASAIGTLNYVVVGLPTDLSDNLSDASSGVETATGSTYLAASFATGTSAFTLNSVNLLLDQSTAGQATVAIYTDGGLQPGTLVGTLSSPSTYSTNLTSTAFTSSTGIALTANTTYWVVLIANSGAYDWSWTSDDTGTGSGFTDTWAEADDGGSNVSAATWFAYNSSPTQFNVIATASA